MRRHGHLNDKGGKVRPRIEMADVLWDYAMREWAFNCVRSNIWRPGWSGLNEFTRMQQ